MVQTLPERVRIWLYATFPERQIYVRSDGRVQFFTFGTSLQASLAAIALIFLGWVAFASVNVLFRDRIIVVKDHRYQQMQANYENRLADLQMSYDELNGALVSTEDKFRSAADQLEGKQQAISRLFSRSSQAAVDIALTGNSIATSLAVDNGRGVAAAPQTTVAPDIHLAPDGSSELNVMPEPVQPQPRSAGPIQASLLEGAAQSLVHAAGAWMHSSRDKVQHSVPMPHSPVLGLLEEQISRVNRLNRSETELLRDADREIVTREGQVESVMRRVGLNPDRLKNRGMGGPLLPMTFAKFANIQDPEFNSVFTSAAAHSAELSQLSMAFGRVPFTTPVHGAGFELTSDFGPRIDPFTHRAGFHPGLDFGGPWGATVSATAPGTVVFAGARGGYGNMVEVDHGFGIHTRYGHLSSILVRIGAKVGKGTPVGKLGSTGRSTGPHVHYEVWLADTVRDPSRFIEAGRHVQ